LKALRLKSTKVDYNILLASLVVVIVDAEEQKDFITFTSSFVRNGGSAAEIFLDGIDAIPRQATISFTSFTELTSVLQDEVNAATIHSISDDLINMQVCGWIDQIKEATVSAAVINSESA
jgi:hypothetical protein